MSGWYIGTQWVNERRKCLLEVWADSLEEATAKFEADEGRYFTHHGVEVLSRDSVTDIHYDRNEGMGR